MLVVKIEFSSLRVTKSNSLDDKGLFRGLRIVSENSRLVILFV